MDPDEGIAYGAALLAGTLAPKPPKSESSSHSGDDVDPGKSDSSENEPPIINDCIPINIGLEIPGNKMDVFLKTGMSVPCAVEKNYMTLADNQHKFKMRVIEGNSQFASECQLLQKFSARNIKPDRKYRERITVTMKVDENQSLKVIVRYPDNKEEGVETEP